MIIRQDGHYEICSLYPNIDWYNEDNFVIDETKKENNDLVQKIKQHAPYIDLVIDNEKIVDVIPTERPPEPIMPPIPTTDDYLIDLDFRISMIELGI